MSDTPATPRPAATLLLLRDGSEGLEVFMVVRHHEIAFAGGARVFPGGRVDANDLALAGQPVLCPPLPQVDDAAMAFRIAAIRETFEESGILLARPQEQDHLIAPERLATLEDWRHRLHANEMKFADLMHTAALSLAADLLVPFAHWITPVVFPKRYDTMFFLAAAPHNHVGVHDGRESVDSLWISPKNAMDDADNGRCKLEFATRRNLEKLGRHGTTADALAAARADTIVMVLPQVSETPQGRTVKIPIDAGYGGDMFALNA